MKAFLIDPLAKSIAAVEYNNTIEHMYQILRCNLVDRVRLDEQHLVWIDDEGLLGQNPEANGFFGLRNYPNVLCGRGLVIGDNGAGGSADATATIEYLRYMIGFQR